MILVDLSQIAYAAIHATTDKGRIDESFLRHLVLNSVLHIQRKHSHKYGKEIVLACDGQHCWRKDYFPPYKWKRHQNKDKDPLDWDSIHTALNKIQQEIRDYFKYYVVKVDEAEGDDVIAVLAKYIHERIQTSSSDSSFGGLILDSEREARQEDFPILIVSSDKDFGQLGYIADQYDPKKKAFITASDPDAVLRYLILKGDDTDGVPNILSDDDAFKNPNKKQNAVGAAKILEWNQLSDQQLRDSDPVINKNWKRNETLVNLRNGTPPEICSKIIQQFTEQEGKKSNNLMNYFFNHHLHKLMENIQEFQ